MLPIKDTIHRTCTPWATWLLVFANTLVFIFQVSLPDELHEIMLYVFGLVPARYTYPAWAHDTTWRVSPSAWCSGKRGVAIGNSTRMNATAT